jgi:hypothetical protein
LWLLARCLPRCSQLPGWVCELQSARGQRDACSALTARARALRALAVDALPPDAQNTTTTLDSLPPDVFPRLEFKYPLLWYHSRFAWSSTEQERTLLHARAAVGTRLPLSLPGRDGTLLVKEADGSCSKRLMALLPRHAADAYFRRLLEPLVASMLQACVRGWLTRRRLIGTSRSDASAAHS